jgi:hypothetical protein
MGLKAGTIGAEQRVTQIDDRTRAALGNSPAIARPANPVGLPQGMEKSPGNASQGPRCKSLRCGDRNLSGAAGIGFNEFCA